MSKSQTLSIGQMMVANRIFLAPMSGVSDLPFRLTRMSKYVFGLNAVGAV